MKNNEKGSLDLPGMVIVIFVPLFIVVMIITIATAVYSHNQDYAAQGQDAIVKTLDANYSNTGAYPANIVQLKNLLNKKNVKFVEKTSFDYSSDSEDEYELLVVNDHFGSTRAATHVTDSSTGSSTK